MDVSTVGCVKINQMIILGPYSVKTLSQFSNIWEFLGQWRLFINTTNITMLHMIAAIAIDIDIIILMVSISTMNVSMLDDGSHCTRGLLPVMGRFFPPR